eukprot:m.354254 g.354254  ORF g.354254 m.354254 type:complete len:61 (+) comp16964_c0_seq1:158-340(+)
MDNKNDVCGYMYAKKQTQQNSVIIVPKEVTCYFKALSSFEISSTIWLSLQDDDGSLPFVP